MIHEWGTAEDSDAAWLTYSANYLLRTAGVRWALDPFCLLTRVGSEVQPEFAKDLDGLQFVVLSHAHSDHLDKNLISAIRCLPITWVVPSFMLQTVIETACVTEDQIIVPQAGCPIHFNGLTLIPFEAQHFRGESVVPEMGYAAEFAGKRWLFPGDTRTYNVDRLPRYTQIDGVFAHLWLGRGCACQEALPLVDEFCSFFTSLNPTRIVVTHLNELGRDENDLWDLHHYRRVLARFRQTASEIQVSSALTGQRIRL